MPAFSYLSILIPAGSCSLAFLSQEAWFLFSKPPVMHVPQQTPWKHKKFPKTLLLKLLQGSFILPISGIWHHFCSSFNPLLCHLSMAHQDKFLATYFENCQLRRILLLNVWLLKQIECWKLNTKYWSYLRSWIQNLLCICGKTLGVNCVLLWHQKHFCLNKSSE